MVVCVLHLLHVSVYLDGLDPVVQTVSCCRLMLLAGMIPNTAYCTYFTLKTAVTTVLSLCFTAHHEQMHLTKKVYYIHNGKLLA